MKKEEMVYGKRAPNRSRKERLSYDEFAEAGEL